jgi:hypothetical protein
VRQFLPIFVWLATWLLLIKKRPLHYKCYRQPLVLLMRCGVLMSEARAMRDGGKQQRILIYADVHQYMPCLDWYEAATAATKHMFCGACMCCFERHGAEGTPLPGITVAAACCS